MNNVLQYLIYLLLPGDFSEENISLNTAQNRKRHFFSIVFLHFHQSEILLLP